MRIQTIVISAIISSLTVIGCSAITDFDNPPPVKIDIKAEVGEPIAVTLDGDVGEITMTFESELPVEAQDDIYELIGTDIQLQVTNEETLVSVFLTESPVDSVPSAAGEYQVVVADNGRDVTIRFYNEALSGQMLRVGGNYLSLLTVAENEWFVTGSFSFDVTVE